MKSCQNCMDGEANKPARQLLDDYKMDKFDGYENHIQNTGTTLLYIVNGVEGLSVGLLNLKKKLQDHQHLNWMLTIAKIVKNQSNTFLITHLSKRTILMVILGITNG